MTAEFNANAPADVNLANCLLLIPFSGLTIEARFIENGASSFDATDETLDKLEAIAFASINGSFSSEMNKAQLSAVVEFRTILEDRLGGHEPAPGAFSATWTSRPVLQAHVDLCASRGVDIDLFAKPCSPFVFDHPPPTGSTSDDYWAYYRSAARTLLADPDCAAVLEFP